MSSFKNFMDNLEKSATKSLPISNKSISSIRASLKKSTISSLASTSTSSDEKEKFAQKVSELTKNDSFLSEFSDRIGEPQKNESEEEFVKRSSNELRLLLYKKLGIKG